MLLLLADIIVLTAPTYDCTRDLYSNKRQSDLSGCGGEVTIGDMTLSSGTQQPNPFSMELLWRCFGQQCYCQSIEIKGSTVRVIRVLIYLQESYN